MCFFYQCAGIIIHKVSPKLVCLLQGTDSQISGVAHGPLVNHTGSAEDLREPTFNKRPMGHIAYLRNFQILNTFMQRFKYTITLIKREVP